jgi:hypothetical protein
MEDGGSHGVRLMRRRVERQMRLDPTHDDEAVMNGGPAGLTLEFVGVGRGRPLWRCS